MNEIYQTMAHRPTRDEIEQIIAMLGEKYPKTFSSQPRQRRPLTKGIINDLIVDGFPVAREQLIRTSFLRSDKALSALLFVASAGGFTGYDPG